MANLYQKNGCSLLFYPGAFNLTTGPAHWELLIRGRAGNLSQHTYICLLFYVYQGLVFF